MWYSWKSSKSQKKFVSYACFRVRLHLCTCVCVCVCVQKCCLILYISTNLSLTFFSLTQKHVLTWHRWKAKDVDTEVFLDLARHGSALRPRTKPAKMPKQWNKRKTLIDSGKNYSALVPRDGIFESFESFASVQLNDSFCLLSLFFCLSYCMLAYLVWKNNPSHPYLMSHQMSQLIQLIRRKRRYRISNKRFTGCLLHAVTNMT